MKQQQKKSILLWDNGLTKCKQEGIQSWKAALRSNGEANSPPLLLFNNLSSTQQLLSSQNVVCLFKEAHYIRIQHISLSKSQTILPGASQNSFSSLSLQTDLMDQVSFFFCLGYLLSNQMIILISPDCGWSPKH